MAFVDAEHALDPDCARTIGVDIDSMLVSQPDTGEQALEITDALVRSGAVDAIVVDSVAAVDTGARIERRDERQLCWPAGQTDVPGPSPNWPAPFLRPTGVVIFINQLRMKIGVMYGNPETTTGGNALKFYASVRLDIRRIEVIKKRNRGRGKPYPGPRWSRISGAPFKEAIFDIMYGEGISKVGEMIDIGVDLGLVQKEAALVLHWRKNALARAGQC